MAVTVLPDVKALVIAYLESHPSITALVSNRVHGDVPTSPTFPLLKVWRNGGSGSWPHYIDRAILQFDAYGRNGTEASNLARVSLAVLKDMPQEHSRGIVTGVEETLGLQEIPDPAYSPAKPRFIFSLMFTVHP